MGNILGNLEPKIVWDIFEEITQIPRPSKREEKIVAYVIDFARKHGLEYRQDKLGNVVIKKPATPGMENRKGVVIQGHLDMVCEKNADVEHDFLNDPIKPYVDGDWVKAQGTTLGADNGIGVAMGLAVLASKDIAHPDVEVLLTLDEETGLTGAQQLGQDLLENKILINLDSEEEGVFIIGCAGGINTSGSFYYESEPVPSNHIAYKISLKGLMGGHSGLEINDGRGNAIKLLNRFLWLLWKKIDFRLSSFDGGNAHNAIPREAFATITFNQKNEIKFHSFADEFRHILSTEWKSKEPNIELIYEKVELPDFVLSRETQKKLLNALYVLPHGVIRFSPDVKGLVQTSTNLAVIKTNPNEIFVLTSQRSSVETEKFDISNQVKIGFELAGALPKQGEGYPSWQPNINSPILEVAKETYTKMFGVAPKIEVIHAGLECGLIGEKYPGMDMISFGPNLKDVHSPAERVQISSVKNIWNFLLEVLKNIPEKEQA
ncbi:aminoacyl-histidine dipeptidase [Bacteroidetes/Chlorobi group bacterium Naka2016]|jgi:dipeptidase D|nr:MAG: aminoacyl-histidine dipeptidase [Bacteroidetes/Chlorobi group bacterium Naka2016]